MVLKSKFRNLWFSLLLLSITALSASAHAAEVEMKTSSGITATAEYKTGKNNKPALLILHGFLQTRHNATVSNLAEELGAEGYTILVPTLSLGISNRKRSLACEAPHPHTFEQDVNEVAKWVSWLQKKGHNNIVLVGHSTGNIALLAYERRFKNPAVKKLIAISLVEYQREFGGHSSKAVIEKANIDARNGDTRLKNYKLSYCNNYLAPAASFVTYINWDMSRIIKLIHSLDTPIYVIAGSADERMHDGWLKRLRATNSIIRQIEGANHFFNSIYQFDLHDQVTMSISE